tara:strand:+ start:4636 stop:4980 length:345 start_codon:yes stop_codon:yes gene_type:complete
MATLTAQQITQAGIVPVTVTPESTGDKLANTGKQFFHIENASGSSVTATVVPVVTTVVDPLLGVLAKEDAVLTLAANEEGFLGPFEVDAFNDVDGNITITCSETASVKLSALYL